MHLKTWSGFVTFFISALFWAGNAWGEVHYCQSLFLPQAEQTAVDAALALTDLAVGQAQSQSKDFSQSKFFVDQVMAELDLGKGFVSKLPIPMARHTQEFQTSDYLSIVAPSLFPPKFMPLHAPHWDRFKKGNLVFDKAHDVISFLSVPTPPTPAPGDRNGTALLADAQRTMLTIFSHKTMSLSSSELAKIEEVIIGKMHSLQKNFPRLARQLYFSLSQMPFMTEKILFEMIEIRKELAPTANNEYLLDLIFGEQHMAANLPVKSLVFQSYILKGKKDFTSWVRMLLPSAMRLGEATNQALLETMTQGKRVSENLLIATYFLKHRLYQEVTVEYLMRLESGATKLSVDEAALVQRLLEE